MPIFSVIFGGMSCVSELPQWLIGKETACNAGVAGRGRFNLSPKDPLEKAMATQASILAWRVPWMEESVGYDPWSRKESDMTEAT